VRDLWFDINMYCITMIRHACSYLHKKEGKERERYYKGGKEARRSDKNLGLASDFIILAPKSQYKLLHFSFFVYSSSSPSSSASSSSSFFWLSTTAVAIRSKSLWPSCEIRRPPSGNNSNTPIFSRAWQTYKDDVSLIKRRERERRNC
jgi:hypothetical protein